MCVICGKRPKGKDETYCTPCLQSIEFEQGENQARRQWWRGAEHVLHYRSQVIALFPSGDKLRPEYHGYASIKQVPTDLVVDMDSWCSGYQRETIKRFKGLFRPYMVEATTRV